VAQGDVLAMSMVLIHSPPDLTTSLARSVICMKPWSSMVPRRRCRRKPSSSRTLPPAPRKYSAADERALDLQVAEALAVVRQAHARVVGQLQLDAERRPALLEGR